MAEGKAGTPVVKIVAHTRTWKIPETLPNLSEGDAVTIPDSIHQALSDKAALPRINQVLPGTGL